MSSKKLINSVESAVDEALEGLTMIHPGLRRLQGHRVVLREKVDKTKVAVLSGGGSGHEPFCAGFIGEGMLTAGIAGSVFASPPTQSILAAIRAVASDNPAGVLMIVINYTGDRINFGLAVERARREGIKVDMFVNGEDCALTTADKTAGRRGLCGTLFTFKIAGAMAEAGEPLEKISATAAALAQNMGTMGVALGPCSLPGQGPLFTVDDGMMELGLGVHGEAGVGRAPLTSASDAVTRLLDHMTNPASGTKLEMKKGEQVALLVSNLGGTSKLEELIVSREIIKQLEARQISVVRVYVGHLMTSLEMAGIIFSILRVTDHPDWLDWLDRPTQAPSWPATLRAASSAARFNPPTVPSLSAKDAETVNKGVELNEAHAERLTNILSRVTNELVGMEDKLNQLDSGSGDGDCGSTLSFGAKAIQGAMGTLELRRPAVLMQQLGNLAEQMGGSSGGIYSLLFTGAAKAFQERENGEAEARDWVRSLRLGLEAVMKYGGAEPGDRTMIDALHPALLTLENGLDKLAGGDHVAVLREAGQAAEAGAAKTASMIARAGRASYVSKDKVVSEDPGAVAAASWFKQIASAF